tara:strand:+ start:827 stop:1177 length:351 start_codon:yes stop_codon:yes gene_type:complete
MNHTYLFDANIRVLDNLNIRNDYDTDLNCIGTPIDNNVLQAAILESRTFVAKNVIRRERNRLLLASDWVVLSDVNLANKNEWITYRQQLRDITTIHNITMDNNGNITDITWPTPPS